MIWHAIRPQALGIIPQFFSEADPRSAREQLHEAYAHGGGVMPFPGFKLKLDRESPGRATITYPGDPAYRVYGWTWLREELILVFNYAWVVIVQPDGDFIATRCD